MRRFEAAVSFGLGLLLGSSAGFAQQSTLPPRTEAQKQSWSLELSNSNLCARQSQLAAPSIFLVVDGFMAGQMGIKAADDLAESASPQVISMFSDLHNSAIGLSMQILNGLSSGALPKLTADEKNAWKLHCADSSCGQSVKTKWEKYRTRTSMDSGSASCVEILQPLPGMFTTHLPTQESLENIALSYLDSEKYVRACDITNKKRAKPDSMYKLSTGLDGGKIDFSYWDSYKIYLSWAWRSGDFGGSPNRQLLKQLPIEDALVMIPEGCYSLTPAQCGTRDLSESQLRTLGGNLPLSLFAKQSAIALRSEIVTPKDVSKVIVRDKVTGQLNQIVFDARVSRTSTIEGYRDFLKSIMSTRLQAFDIVNKNLSFLQVLFNQVDEKRLTYEFNQSLGTTSEMDRAEIAVTCNEARGLVDKEMTLFARELDLNRDLFSILTELNFPGTTPTNLVAQAMEAARKIVPICIELDKRQELRLIKNDNSYLESSPWVKRLSLKVLVDEDSNKQIMPNAEDLRTKNFLRWKDQGLCVNPVQCIRQMVSSVADLYSMSLYLKSVNSFGSPQTHKMSENYADAVACGSYDPWIESKNRRTKLRYDLATAAISGILPIPVHLDLTPGVRTVKTFKSLVEDGEVRFTPEYNDPKIRMGLIADLGPLVHAPCAVSIGLNGGAPKAGTLYSFAGISGERCSRERATEDTTGGASAEVTKSKSYGVANCGSCTYIFEPLLRQAVSSTVGARQVIALGRVFTGIVRYFGSAQKIDIPRSFSVNPEAVAATYKKYNSIPKECVWELQNGATCMKNLCVSSAVAQFEKKTGLRVTDTQVYEGGDRRHGKQLWLKLSDCEGDVGFDLSCRDKDSKAEEVNLRQVSAFQGCRQLMKQKGIL